MSKILFSQVDPSDLKSAEMFKCFSNNSHLVEEPVICQTQSCQHLYCKSCLISLGFCKGCLSKSSNHTHIPPFLLNSLNQIYLKCENQSDGCQVEIDYQSYRNHVKNCKFKSHNIAIVSDADRQKSIKKLSVQSEIKFEKAEKSSAITGTAVSSQSSEALIKPQSEFSGADIFSDDYLKYKKRENLEKFTVEELKSFLEIRRISKTGNKDDLIFKLLSYFVYKSLANNQGSFENFLKKLNNTADYLSDMTIPQLKEILSSNGLTISGNKMELIERIAFAKEKSLLNQTTQKMLNYSDPSKKINEKPFAQEKHIPFPTIVFRDSRDDLEDLESEEEDSECEEEELECDEEDLECEEEDSDENEYEQNSKRDFPNSYFLSERKLADMSAKDMQLLTVEDLKALLEERGIPKTGLKDELIEKLQTYYRIKKNEKKKKLKMKMSKNKTSTFDKKSLKIKKKLKFESKTIDELKFLLAKKGLPVSGNKGELIERLLSKKKAKSFCETWL